MITAEEKVKHQKNGNTHRYTYYHCTRRKDPNCKEPAIEEAELEKQIAKEIGSIEIPADFTKWALARLREMNTQEASDRERIYGAQRREYDACVRKVDNLIDMRANGELTDKRVENWLEVAERGFNFAEKAAAQFAEAKKKNNFEVRKEIFATLGSDLLLKGRKLSIDWDNLLFPIQTMAKEVRAIHAGLEPVKNKANKRDMGEIYSKNPILLRELDGVRTHLLEGKSEFFYRCPAFAMPV